MSLEKTLFILVMTLLFTVSLLAIVAGVRQHLNIETLQQECREKSGIPFNQNGNVICIKKDGLLP